MKPVLMSGLVLVLSVTPVLACSGNESKNVKTTPVTTPASEVDSSNAADTTAGEEMAARPELEDEDGTADGPTNLQVLPATWSKTEVTVYMKEITRGLGVQCDHCHPSGDNASDELPNKLAARKMIEMTRELDANHLGGNGLLTCFTCHQGNSEPSN